jgi:ADP-ribosylglycohydrolase
VTASVNHSGDSDSTGAITGAILGTLLGYEAIPRGWIERLENSQKIEDLADEMYRIFKEQPS